MANQPWYLDWFDSPFRHSFIPARPLEKDRFFLSNLISHLAPVTGSRWLDAACGTGNFARELSQQGFEVTGIDLAAGDIEMARQQESDKLRFFVHDLRLPFYSNYFNFAINLFNRFGYYRTRREHEAALRTIARALKPGGRLIFDYINDHFAEDHLLPTEDRKVGAVSFAIARHLDEHHFYTDLTISDPGLSRPITSKQQMARLTLGDFTEMLSYQGMQIDEVFGDYDLSPFDIRTSSRLLFIAKNNPGHPEDSEKRVYSDGRRTDPLT